MKSLKLFAAIALFGFVVANFTFTTSNFNDVSISTLKTALADDETGDAIWIVINTETGRVGYQKTLDCETYEGEEGMTCYYQKVSYKITCASGGNQTCTPYTGSYHVSLGCSDCMPI